MPAMSMIARLYFCLACVCTGRRFKLRDSSNEKEASHIAASRRISHGLKALNAVLLASEPSDAFNLGVHALISSRLQAIVARGHAFTHSNPGFRHSSPLMDETGSSKDIISSTDAAKACVEQGYPLKEIEKLIPLLDRETAARLENLLDEAQDLRFEFSMLFLEFTLRPLPPLSGNFFVKEIGYDESTIALDTKAKECLIDGCISIPLIEEFVNFLRTEDIPERDEYYIEDRANVIGNATKLAKRLQAQTHTLIAGVAGVKEPVEYAEFLSGFDDLSIESLAEIEPPAGWGQEEEKDYDMLRMQSVADSAQLVSKEEREAQSDKTLDADDDYNFFDKSQPSRIVAEDADKYRTIKEDDINDIPDEELLPEEQAEKIKNEVDKMMGKE